MIVGTAEVVILPDTEGFAAAVDAETQGALGGFSKDAKQTGEDANRDLRDGLNSDQLAMDLGEAGAVGGRDMREKAAKEAEGLSGDLEKEGEKGGEGLSKGVSSGLSKLANLISNTGLPLGGLSSGLEKSAKAAEHAEGSTSGLTSQLGSMGGPLFAVGAGIAVVGAAAVDMGMHMETAEASIKGVTGQSTSEVKKIGAAFLDTAGTSEFSGEKMAAAFAEVAGQLKATVGHALGAREALQVMTASSTLAEAKQIELGEATGTVSKVMQAFKLGTTEAAHVSDILFAASNATGQSVEGLANQLTKAHSKLGETGGSVGQLSGLLVDMTERGITGRAAMAALNTAMNGLQKDGLGVVKATEEQKNAFKSMAPQAQALAKAYTDGSVSSKEFKKQSEGLGPQQEALLKAYAKSGEAITTANQKYKELGVTVFNAQGAFVGMGSIIEQLHPRFLKMSEAQQLAAATTLFGAGAARQMVEVIDAGPAAYQKATEAVEKHGTAEKAAKAQAETLHGEIKVLTATFESFAGKIGGVVIPATTLFIKGTMEMFKVTEMMWKGVAVDYRGVESVILSVVHAVTQAWQSYERLMVGIVRGIVSVVSSGWREVESKTSSLVSAVAGFFSKLPGEITKTLGALPGELLKIGEQIVEGLVHGIEAGAGKVVSAAEGLVNKIPGAVKSILGISSPSKVMEEHGVHIAEGLAAGMRKGTPTAAAASAALGKAALEALWIEAGGSKSSANLAAAIALAESGGHPGSTDNDSNGTVDRGLWQINSSHGAQSTYNEKANARSAVELSGGGRDFTPWVTYKTGAYKQYLGGAGQGAPLAATSSAAEQKAGTERQVAEMRKALADWVAKMTAEEKTATGARKAQIAQEIAEHKAMVTQEIASVKAGATEKAAILKAQASKETSDKKAGEKERTTLETQIQSQSLKGLNSSLLKVHETAVKQLEHTLSQDHQTALKKLSGELVKVWKDAAVEQAKLQAKANEEAAQKAAERAATEAETRESNEATAISKASQIQAHQLSNQAQAIQDATKVTLDKQAEVGASGTTLITDHLQTVADEVLAGANKEIGQALIGEDQASGTGKVAEAQAAANLARVEGEAKVREAEANARVELSKKEAGLASTSGGTQAGISIENLVINGAGMSSGELINELGWSLKTGALPVAQPVA